MNERELTTVLNQFKLQTGLSARVMDYTPLVAKEGYANAMIQFDRSEHSLLAHINEWGIDSFETNTLGGAELVSDCNREKILITEYINDELGQRLRELKYNYLDKAGNAFLDIAPVYVLIEGKSLRVASLDNKTPRLFNETGLKVIFALLATPELLNANYRKIADYANVSMGTIGWVLRELKSQGFTKEVFRITQWNDKPGLIKKWTEEYPKLRVKNHIGTYQVKNKGWWKELDLIKYQVVLGGELAALEYKPDDDIRNSTIYVDRLKRGSLIRDLELVKVEKHNHSCDQSVSIELMERFWGSPDRSMANNTVTHPLITYADLMGAWKSTSRETAHQIAEHYSFYKNNI